LLGKRSFPKDILPIYTVDVAAIIIQRKWRTILIRSFFQALARATYDEIWDPVVRAFLSSPHFSSELTLFPLLSLL
jgi:hypothetical protein